MKFRKRPVVIDAVIWTGKNISEISKFMGGSIHYMKNDDLFIGTLEGDHKANIGDWIIKGVKGEFYPCKPEIFIKTYERAD